MINLNARESFLYSSRAKTMLYIPINFPSKCFSGGYYITTKEYAKECMAMIDEILAGTPASEIPFGPQNAEAQTHLNYADLIWFNVPDSLHPKDAYYYNKPLSPYEPHRRSIQIGILIVGIIIVLRLYSIGQTKK